MTRRIGILHPGEMGTFVAACAQERGCDVCWASAGRSGATRARAEAHAFIDLGTVDRLAADCDILISVCPPHAAEAVAHQVLDAGFRGLYVDANAIAPQRAVRMARELSAAGIRFVDGGIVGQPAWQPGATWLHLSGPDAGEVAACFSAGSLPTVNLGPKMGRASALKMCFAANTKGTAALHAAILGAADRLGVRESLETQWEAWQPGLSERVATRVRSVARKGWRFAGEMGEIATTLESAGMPGGFHRGAGEIYRRLTGFKTASEMPPLRDVLDALERESESGSSDPPPRPARLYHIATVADLERADGQHYASEAFGREGFLHCSYAHQVLAVAHRLFRGRQDLRLLEIDPGAVGHRIVDENLEGGSEQYPHIYGRLPLSAVTRTRTLPIDDRGNFVFPE